MSNCIINQAVEAVMDLIDGLGLFALIYRGPLGTDNGLCCELGPTSPDEVYLDKNRYIPIDLTINGKHNDLNILTEALNKIDESLTMRTSYPSTATWKIVDISTATEPQVINREDSNQYVMASSLLVKIETKL